MARFFISYRRGDSAGHTGRLNDTLAQRFGHDVVFRDIEDLAPGVDFAAELDRALSECNAMLVVIGRTWASVADESGKRLFQDGDFVRHEVAAALARDDVTVIPVLVDGATFPAAEGLPADLQGLRGRNAIEITDGRWDYDMRRLGDALAAQLGIGDLNAEPEPKRRFVPVGILIAAFAVVAVVAIFLVVKPVSTGTSDTTVQSALEDTVDQTTTVPSTTVAVAEATAEAEQAGPTTIAPVVTTTFGPALDIPTFAIKSLNWTTDTEPIGTVDWIEASDGCQQVSVLGVTFRLPTIEELESIVDRTHPDAFERKVLTIFHDGMGSNWIWSSDEDGATSAFAYDFTELSVVSLVKTFDEGARALCVADI